MLLFLSLQITSGMMSDDEIATAGPLVAHVSGSWVSYATFYHKAIGKWVLLGLVAMHLVAVGFHFFVKRDNLVKPMLSGDKTLPIEAVSSIDSATRRFLALTIVSICSASVAALVYWLER
jgi:cytochrome b